MWRYLGVAAQRNLTDLLGRQDRDVRRANGVRVRRDLESRVLRAYDAQPALAHEGANVNREIRGDDTVPGEPRVTD